MMRIFITGAVGSGKSFVAQRVARDLNLPIISLDDCFFDLESDSYRKKRDAADRFTRLAKAISGNEWVAEGWHFGPWLNPLFERVTCICIVDTPLHIRYWRITKRFAKRKLGLQNDPYAKGGFSHLLKLYQWTKLFDAKKHIPEARPRSNEPLSVYSAKSADDLLKCLSKEQKHAN